MYINELIQQIKKYYSQTKKEKLTKKFFQILKDNMITGDEEEIKKIYNYIFPYLLVLFSTNNIKEEKESFIELLEGIIDNPNILKKFLEIKEFKEYFSKNYKLVFDKYTNKNSSAEKIYENFKFKYRYNRDYVEESKKAIIDFVSKLELKKFEDLKPEMVKILPYIKNEIGNYKPQKIFTNKEKEIIKKEISKIQNTQKNTKHPNAKSTSIQDDYEFALKIAKSKLEDLENKMKSGVGFFGEKLQIKM